MWLGMFGVVCGLVMVGVADIVFGNNSETDRNAIISGTPKIFSPNFDNTLSLRI